MVLHAYNVPVEAVWVVYSEEKKDWHGGTEMLVRASGHLSDAERVAILAAGRAAEELFQCRAHSPAWLRDFGEIASLLDRKGVGHELWRRIDRRDAQARAILSKDRDAAIRLIDWLVEQSVLQFALHRVRTRPD